MNKDILNKIINYSYTGDFKEKELTPQRDTRASFYHKAIVKTCTIDYKRYDLLFSYNTLVCVCVLEEDEKHELTSRYYLNHDVKENYLFSNTTLRHIKDFLYQYNIKYLHDESLTKADIIKNESEA